MNNMKYYNDSLAYDFERFMPSVAPDRKREDNIVKLPSVRKKQQAKRKAAAKSLSVSAFAVMAACFMLAALCGNILMRLQINEVNSKINDIKTEINALDSQQTSLEVELERRLSFSNIEIEAAQLGMHKMDKSQVKYIRVNEKNTAETDSGTVISEN